MKLICSTLILIGLYLNGSVAIAQSNTVEIWVRSFIPDKAHAGAASTNILNDPSGAGSLVEVKLKEIPLLGKLIAAAMPSACLDPDKDRMCFVTDNRGFSSEPGSTARTDTKFTIKFNAEGTATVSPSSGRTTTGLTKRLNCETGAVLAQMPGKVDLDALGAPAVAGDVVQVIGQVRATDQLVPCAPTFFTPSADCSFDIKWNRTTTELTVDFTFGTFPAFEIYARQPGNDWTPVFQQLPLGEAWQLAGDGLGFKIATVRKTVTARIPGLSGKWQSPAPDQRFTLEIVGNKVNWTERNSAGALLTRDVPMQDVGNGSFRIERPNDNEVLTFLGFQQNLRNEILARNPQPSFIIFHKDKTTITGEWNGLIVTKDNQARLKELIQPGVRPAKIVTFTQI